MSAEEKGRDPELRRLSRSAILRHYVDAAAARLSYAEQSHRVATVRVKAQRPI